MAAASPPSRSRASTALVFADLFLEDIRAYREEQLAASGRTAVFPVWGRDTSALAASSSPSGSRRSWSASTPRGSTPPSPGARSTELLADLPDGVDPCGENGEFHTFVHAGPIFDRPIPIATATRSPATASSSTTSPSQTPGRNPAESARTRR